jgi:hypothetical protein
MTMTVPRKEKRGEKKAKVVKVFVLGLGKERRENEENGVQRSGWI